jgi:hypothetical protein
MKVSLSLNQILLVFFAGGAACGISTFFGAALALALSKGHVKLLRLPTIGHMFRNKGKESTS